MIAAGGDLLALLSAAEPRAQVSPLALDDTRWNAVVRESIRHGVAPLVHARLNEAAPHVSVPERARHELKAAYLRTGLENLRLFARLGAALRSLAAEGIDAIVLKGAFLAELVYGNPALRSMGDADVLVRRGDLDRVTRLLRDQGWRQSSGDAQIAGHQLPTFVLDRALLEIHWAIEDDGSPFDIDTDGLWRRASKVRVAGVPALALAPEDLLLHLCVHASYSHGWLQFSGGLRPLCDIALTVRHYAGRFDWEAFVYRADTWRVRNCVWLTLVLTRELLRAAIPGEVFDLLAPTPDAGWVETAKGLTLGAHYSELSATLPALGRNLLTRQWRHLPRAARWRRQLLPARGALAAAYPSLGRRPSLRYVAHWADFTRDCVRAFFAPHARALLEKERNRLALIGWLENLEPPGHSTQPPVVSTLPALDA